MGEPKLGLAAGLERLLIRSASFRDASGLQPCGATRSHIRETCGSVRNLCLRLTGSGLSDLQTRLRLFAAFATAHRNHVYWLPAFTAHLLDYQTRRPVATFFLLLFSCRSNRCYYQPFEPSRLAVTAWRPALFPRQTQIIRGSPTRASDSRAFLWKSLHDGYKMAYFERLTGPKKNPKLFWKARKSTFRRAFGRHSRLATHHRVRSHRYSPFC